MIQASKRRQSEAKEGWVKAGARVSTQQASEGIMLHTGETPSWWFVSTLQVRSCPLIFLSPLLFRYWPLVQVKLRQFSSGNISPSRRHTMPVTFTKVALPFGFLSNMAPYAIEYD